LVAAGDLLVERLNNEHWRSDALADMQFYAETKRLPFDAIQQGRWQQVLAQPKVIKALDKVGRIEVFSLAP